MHHALCAPPPIRLAHPSMCQTQRHLFRPAATRRHRVRRIVYWGNCQMEALCRMHVRFAKPSTNDVVSCVNPYQPHPLTGTERAAIEDADLIVGQVHNQKSLETLAALSSAAPRHLVPMVGAGFLWPFSGQPHSRNLRVGIFAGE